MFQKILVPLDGSKRAERILGHVENLAINNRANVVFLRVVKPQHSVASHQDNISWQNQELWRRTKIAESYLSGLKGEFREKGIPSVLRVSNGSVAKSILRTAEHEDADLIAIASHTRNGLNRCLMEVLQLEF